MSGIERRTGVALWRQIADDIRAAIGNGDHEDGRLPTEAALAARFNVNRHTVRQAVAALAREGVVETVQGRGTTIVPRRRVTYPIGARTRFSAGLGGQVALATTRLISASTEAAGEDLATALHVAPGASLLRLETLGEADGMPLSRAVHWFDAERFSGLVEAYGREGSITRALAACGVPDYVRVSTEISAVPATASDRTDLALQPGAVVLLTRSVNADPQGCPIQVSHSRFAADRVMLSVATGEAQGDLP